METSAPKVAIPEVITSDTVAPKKRSVIKALIDRLLFFRKSPTWQILAEAWVVQNEAGQPINRTDAEREFLPAVLELQERPPSPLGRICGRVIILCLLIGLTWMAFAPRPIHVVMSGKIVPSSHVHVIESLEDGVITDIHVRNGDQIKKDDTLLTMDFTEVEADRMRLENEMQTAQFDVIRLQATLTNLLSGEAPDSTLFDGATKKEGERQWHFLSSTLAARQAENMSLVSDEKRFMEQAKRLEETVSERRRVVALIKQRLDLFEGLYAESEGALSLEGLLRVRQEHVQGSVELVNVVGALQEARENIQGVAHRKTGGQEKAVEQVHRELAEAKSRKQAVEQELIKARQREERKRLRAPTDGIIANTVVRTLGEVIQAGERLMTVVPRDALLEIEAVMQNKDRGDVWINQAARVKVEAYPFTKYGVLPGEITHISSDAVEVEGQGLMFPVHIKLLKDTIYVRGNEVDLGVGLRVTIEAQAGSQTVLQYLVTPLARIADEAMRER